MVISEWYQCQQLLMKWIFVLRVMSCDREKEVSVIKFSLVQLYTSNSLCQRINKFVLCFTFTETVKINSLVFQCVFVFELKGMLLKVNCEMRAGQREKSFPALCIVFESYLDSLNILRPQKKYKILMTKSLCCYATVLDGFY